MDYMHIDYHQKVPTEVEQQSRLVSDTIIVYRMQQGGESSGDIICQHNSFKSTER